MEKANTVRVGMSDSDALFQQNIFDSGDGYAAYNFAKQVDGADIRALQNVILCRGTGDNAYRFAKHTTGADITTLQDVVMQRGNGRDAYRFAQDIKGADLHRIYDRLVTLCANGKDDGYLARFNADATIQSSMQSLTTGVPRPKQSATSV